MKKKVMSIALVFFMAFTLFSSPRQAESATVIDPMTVTVKAQNSVEQGNVPDGWYHLRCMYNYLSINAKGEAEFNDAKPYQKFKFTYQGSGAYRIETENGKVLSLANPTSIGNGNRVIAKDTTPFDWLLGKEGSDLFSLRPYAKDSVIMNASEEKRTNGTHIIVWTHATAAEHSRWRLIPASPAETGTNQTITALDVTDGARLGGSDRYATAIAISKEGWTKSENVILANGFNFPSALAGSSLAYLKDSPMLLTDPNKLNSTIASEIKRLGAKTVYILGNQSEVSVAVENELKSQYNVVRIAGTDLFNTAVKIGEEVQKLKSFDTVALATQNDFPDTLAITPFSAKNTMPILFSEKDKLRSDTKSALSTWGIKNVIIAGGVGVISAAVEKELQGMGIKVTRLAGDDRYDTALAIVKFFEKDKYTKVALATGLNYPDALAGAALAAKKGAPLLLVGRDSIKKTVFDYIDDHTEAYIFGGEGVIANTLQVK